MASVGARGCNDFCGRPRVNREIDKSEIGDHLSQAIFATIKPQIMKFG
jgi:hypothetical protein